MDFPMVRSLLSVDGGPLLFLVRSPLPLYACREWGYYISSLFTGRITADYDWYRGILRTNRCH
jgi:hypothetical protein